MRTLSELVKGAASVVPDERQVKWQEIGFYAFIHFSPNTFTDREWGLGDEDPAIFNPTKLDADQWVTSCKSAGMKGVVITAKHHDGFCLWPSKYTEHSVKNCPWKDGKGDVVREVANACRRHDMHFGIYLSPWDRNSKYYGTDEYNDYYVNQLTELMTNYGDIFMVWLDGACGEGTNGKRQWYDFERWYGVIRHLQPMAVIQGCGPDVRWIGNEDGRARPNEWSVIQGGRSQVKLTPENENKYNSDIDLGSLSMLRYASYLGWSPAEADLSLRPGWFFHENEHPHSLERLFNTYINIIGGNAGLILNVPPNREGLFAEEDVKRLKEIGDKLRNIFDNIKPGIDAHSEETEEGEPVNITKNDDSFWQGNAEQCEIVMELGQRVNFDYIEIGENIRRGQHVETFEVASRNLDGNWNTDYIGFIIGYKKIFKVDPRFSDAIRIRIINSRTKPCLRYVAVYDSGTRW